MAIEIIKTNGSKLLVGNGNKFAVVIWNAQAGQVQANGYYAAGKSENAINYVAKWVSRSTAERQLRAN